MQLNDARQSPKKLYYLDCVKCMISQLIDDNLLVNYRLRQHAFNCHLKQENIRFHPGGSWTSPLQFRTVSSCLMIPTGLQVQNLDQVVNTCLPYFFN